MAAKKAKKSSNKGPGSDFGPLLGGPKPPKQNTGPTRSQQQASRILFGPQNANVQEMGVGGYKTAVVRAARQLSNVFGRQRVIVHGSPTQGLGVLRPPANPAAIQSPTESGRFVFGKSAEAYRFGASPTSESSVLKYTGTLSGSQKAGWGTLRGSMRDFAPGGSVYVGKAPSRNVTSAQKLWSDSAPSSVVVRGPVKVLSEIRVPPAATPQQAQSIVEAQLRRALMDAGVRGTGRSSAGAGAAAGGAIAAGAGAAAVAKQRKGGTRTRGSKSVKRGK